MMGVYLIGALLISVLLFLNRKKVIKHSLLGVFVVLQWGITIYSFFHINTIDTEFFMPDALGVIFLTVISIICIPAFYHSTVYFSKHSYIPRARSIYYSAMVILISSLSAAYLSNHFGATWVFVELTTLAASALVYHRRNILTLEATWKYIFVCSISITMVFIGILFLTIAIQEEGSKDLTFKSLILQAPHLNVFWLKLAFLFIFTGFTSKAGLVPMYTAGIDAKDAAPYPAGALLSSVLMNVGFIGIFRVYEIIFQSSAQSWANNIMYITGFLSVFVATVYMIRVKNLKRMMAYSSVEHMGLVIIGLASGSLGRYAAILHLILHSFAKSSLFFQFGQIYRTYKSKSINDIGNYFKYNTTGA
jgi:hydrogenase-4 component F